MKTDLVTKICQMHSLHKVLPDRFPLCLPIPSSIPGGISFITWFSRRDSNPQGTTLGFHPCGNLDLDWLFHLSSLLLTAIHDSGKGRYSLIGTFAESCVRMYDIPLRSASVLIKKATSGLVGLEPTSFNGHSYERV